MERSSLLLFLDLTAITTRTTNKDSWVSRSPWTTETSGRFYVSYTTDGTTPGGKSVIARYHVSSDPNIADAASDTTILEADQPYINHNGGMIVFGPDGFSTWDSGTAGTPAIPGGSARNGMICSARCSGST